MTKIGGMSCKSCVLKLEEVFPPTRLTRFLGLVFLVSTVQVLNLDYADQILVTIGNETYKTEGNYASKKDAEKSAALQVYKKLENAPTPIQKNEKGASADAVIDVDAKIPEEDSANEVINWKNKLQVVK